MERTWAQRKRPATASCSLLDPNSPLSIQPSDYGCSLEILRHENISNDQQKTFSSLRSQRDANTDLYLTHQEFKCNLNIKLEWIKSHSDKEPWESICDLDDQGLSRDQIFNVWCDRMAEKTWRNGPPSFYNPEVSISEKWTVYAKYPHFHKLSGKLDTGFYSIIGYSNLAKYMQQKHQLTEAKLQWVNLLPLHHHLTSMKPHNQASVSKLIHRWIPMYSTLSRQGRVPSPFCPRSHTSRETWDHVFSCSNVAAMEVQCSALLSFLSTMVKLGTPLYVLTKFKFKLSNMLNIPYKQQFT